MILLQEQSFRLLLALIEADGQLVTREELQKQLWPHGTLVEFDLGINAAVKRLRRVLGDWPDDPKYVETVARRGYRLLVPVVWLRLSSGDAGADTDKDHGPARPASLAGSLIGQEVSHYRILEVLGEGGMGIIYKAEDLRLRRLAALKFLPEEFSANSRALASLEREACLASSLNHPNICSVYELGTHAGQPFIAMELLAGATLRDSLAPDVPGAIATARPVPLNKLLTIAIQVCEGLKAAHEKGIVHRDIKPANLFITSAGVVKILDFGLAKLIESETGEGQSHRPDETPTASASSPTLLRSSPTGIAIGTAAYMSPEQIRGEKLDARTDLFSLGVVLYQMATGLPPFQGESPDLLFDAILHTNPAAPDVLDPSIPLALRRIVDRALEKDRDRRYQSATEMQSELRRLAKEISSSENAGAATVGPVRTIPARRWRSVTWKVAVTVVLIAGIVTYGLYRRWRMHQAVAVSGKGTLVVAEFDNKTGDSIFDDTLKESLGADLTQSPFLALLSGERIEQTLALMGKPATTRLTPEIAREICLRSGSTATVDGSIAVLGREYVIGLRVVNCHNGDELATQQFTVDGKEKILSSLGKAASQIRQNLGESLASVQQHNAPLDNATTSSLEALKAFGDAERAGDSGDYQGAIAAARRAVDLDPKFAGAYLILGITYDNLHEEELCQQNLRKAYELRDRVSEHERYVISTFYADKVTGNLETARRAYQQWMDSDPNTLVAPSQLGIEDAMVGDYDDAIILFDNLAKKYPKSPLSALNVAGGYLYLDRLDEAKATVQKAKALHLDTPALHVVIYDIDFLEHDMEGMQREAASLMGNIGWEDQMLYAESDTAAYAGQFTKARWTTAQAINSAKRAKENVPMASYYAEAAVREALVGNPEMGRKQARAALAISRNKDVAGIAAIALAAAGDVAEATRLSNDLTRRFPEDTVVQFNYLPTAQAAIALRGGNATKALTILTPAKAYELGALQGSVNFNLYPIYLRGETFLAASDGSAAAREFQKIVDHPGIVINEPIGALAYLGLGRAYALSGEAAKARSAYHTFLILWNHADPDIPVYKQANAEYARLSNHMQ